MPRRERRLGRMLRMRGVCQRVAWLRSLVCIPIRPKGHFHFTSNFASIHRFPMDFPKDSKCNYQWLSRLLVPGTLAVVQADYNVDANRDSRFKSESQDMNEQRGGCGLALPLIGLYDK